MFNSRPKVYYIWRSGNNISGKFSPYWNDLEKRIKASDMNITTCDVDNLKEPDLANYEKSKQNYTTIPLVRLVSSKGNRYDYNISDDYKYYYGGINGDYMSGRIASNKIYKMIMDNYDK